MRFSMTLIFFEHETPQVPFSNSFSRMMKSFSNYNQSVMKIVSFISNEMSSLLSGISLLETKKPFSLFILKKVGELTSFFAVFCAVSFLDIKLFREFFLFIYWK